MNNKYSAGPDNVKFNRLKIYSRNDKIVSLHPPKIEKLNYNDTKALFNITISLTEKGQNIINTLDQFICSEFNVTKEELKSDGRYMPLPKARGAFTSILRSNFNFPLKVIGMHLGGRDHSSILMAERRAKEFYKKNESYRFNYDNILKRFMAFLSDNGYLNETIAKMGKGSGFVDYDLNTIH